MVVCTCTGVAANGRHTSRNSLETEAARVPLYEHLTIGQWHGVFFIHCTLLIPHEGTRSGVLRMQKLRTPLVRAKGYLRFPFFF